MKKIIRWFAYKYVDYHAFKREIEKIKYGASGKKRLTFSKKMTIAILINLVVVQIYSMYVMLYLQDLTALPTFITTICGELVTAITYTVKSAVENSSGGLTYELAMKNPHNIVIDDDDAEG